MSDDPQPTDPPRGDDRDPHDPSRGSAGDELLAAAEDLASSSDGGWRSRTSTVRRPRRGPRDARQGRDAPEPGLLDDAEEPERVRVRSSAEEVRGRRSSPPEDRVADGSMLDANGQVIRPPGSDEPADVSSGAAGDPGHSGAAAPTVVDGRAFLADAIRTYLAGVDAFGPEHEVTRDRRDRLRRTLELWDRG